MSQPPVSAPARSGWRLGPVTDWSGRTVRYLPAGTVEFLRVAVIPPPGSADPTVAMAIVPRGTVPAPGDWQPMVWADGVANLLLADTVDVGEYVLWADVTAGAERPLREVGLLTVLPGPGRGPAPPPAPDAPGYMPAYLGTYLGDPDDGFTAAGDGYMPEALPPYLGESA